MQRLIRASLGRIVAVLLMCTAFVAAATLQVGAQASPPAHPNAATTLTQIGPFEATVYAGPDRGLSLHGRLSLRLTRTGALTGVVAPERGTAIPLSGQLTGYAISLVFYLGHGRHIFGVGAIGREPGTTQWVLGGPLVGPKEGDSGAWDGAVTAPAGALVLAIHTDGSLKT